MGLVLFVLSIIFWKTSTGCAQTRIPANVNVPVRCQWRGVAYGFPLPLDTVLQSASTYFLYAFIDFAFWTFISYGLIELVNFIVRKRA